VQAVHGGARRRAGSGMGPRPGANRGEAGPLRTGGGRRGEDGEGVCFYRGVYRFLFSVRVAIPFFGKISAKPSARHDVLRRGGIPLRPPLLSSLSPLLRCLCPARL